MFFSSLQRSQPILPKTTMTSGHQKPLVMTGKDFEMEKEHIPKETVFNLTWHVILY